MSRSAALLLACLAARCGPAGAASLRQKPAEGALDVDAAAAMAEGLFSLMKGSVNTTLASGGCRRDDLALMDRQETWSTGLMPCFLGNFNLLTFELRPTFSQCVQERAHIATSCTSCLVGMVNYGISKKCPCMKPCADVCFGCAGPGVDQAERCSGMPFGTMKAKCTQMIK
mmetsp:Transcript_14913/g.43582  ORF Transcript_14913/g.43582 Transcript_14913/m.43582 type:complete len:171 (-) Transcript_14913:52-564(-)